MRASLNPLPRLAKRLHPHTLGMVAEKIALLALLCKGYRPIAQPRRALAQTDLLLTKGHSLILVEVKYRPTPERAHLALTPQQKQRLTRQARALAGKYPQKTLRLDLVLVTPIPPFLQHVPNIPLE